MRDGDRGDVAESPPLAHRRRPITVVEWVGLIAAATPIVAAVVRAGVVGWMPLFDAGYFTARSRDVMTTHHPLVGAWSMGSRTIETWVNNLGPLQLDLLAPLTKMLDPHWGTAVGTGAINLAAVMAVWVTARRMFSPAGVAVAMTATVLLQSTMGSLNLIEARQQLAMLLPFWCLLWLAAAVATGASWALPPAVFVASLVVQTHFTFIYPTTGVMLIALIGWTVTHRSDRRAAFSSRPTVAAAAVLVVCWAQPLWDQLFGSGNLGAVIASSGDADGVGAVLGARLIADAVLVPPFWLPGTMGELLRGSPLLSAPAAWAALALWAAALAGASAVARHLGRRPVAAIASIAVTALAGGLIAATQIPPTTQFGIVPYNYYWMWPIALFATVAIGGAIVSAAATTAAWQRVATAERRPAGLGALGVVVVLAALPVLRPANPLPETSAEDRAGIDIGRPLIGQLTDSLGELGIDGPIVIDRTRESTFNHFRYTILTELDRHGIEFLFPPGSTDLARFGTDRCDDGRAAGRLILAVGDHALHPRADEVVLASVDAMDDGDAAELADLELRFGELLREGIVTVDEGAIVYLGHVSNAHLGWVMAADGRPANGIADWMARWHGFAGVVDMPDDVVDEFRRWVELERRSLSERYAIFLGPPGHEAGVDLARRCATRPPGYEDLQAGS